MDAIGLLTSNIENVQTPGFKQENYTFQTIFDKAYGVGANSYSTAGGVNMKYAGLTFTQGGLNTGGALNAAIQGDTLFVVEDFNKTAYIYKRASDFAFTSDGYLVDGLGRKVMAYKMSADGSIDKTKLTYIYVDPTKYDLADLGFEAGGILITNYKNRKNAIANGVSPLPNGTPLYILGLAKFASPENLAVSTGNAYRATIDSGQPIGYGTTTTAGFGTIVGASKESSNVDPSALAIEGMQLQRGYNAVQGAVNMVNRVLTDFIKSISQ